MEDFIAKGTGDSRKMKSVSNLLELAPTYPEFIRLLTSGEFTFDLNGINPAGIQKPGTPLTKATMIPDNVADAYGEDRKAVTLADILLKLAEAAFIGSDGLMTNVSGQDRHPIYTTSVQAKGTWPAKYSLPFTPCFVIMIGHSTAGDRGVSFIRGGDGSGKSLTAMGKSGIVANWHYYISEKTVVLGSDPGGAVAGANNVRNGWEYIIAVR